MKNYKILNINWHEKSLVIRDCVIVNKDSVGIYKALFQLYKRGGLDSIIACLLNRIISSDAPCFMMSKRIMEEFVKEDPNMDRQSLNSSEYKHMEKELIEKGIIEVLEKSSSNKVGEARKAALWRLLDKEIREELKCYNMIDDREQILIEEYNTLQGNKLKKKVVWNKI